MSLEDVGRAPARGSMSALRRLLPWAALLCIGWCLLAGGVSAARLARGGALDTDIQRFLPEQAIEPIVRDAMRAAGDEAARQVVVLVHADDPDTARAAAGDLEGALTATGMFASDRAEGEAAARWLFANRNELLCEVDPTRFDAHKVEQRSLGLLYSPASPVSGALLTHDPFLLTLQLAGCLVPGGARTGDASVVSGRLSASSFRLDVEDAVGTAYDAWRARWPAVEASRTGAVFEAREGARRARAEVSLVGTLSGIGVLALFIACFRRWPSVAGAMLATAAGTVGSLGATLLLFPQVHVLVFVFGGALVGVTSDYALHFLATGPQTRWAPVEERVRAVVRPLLVCALTTGLGFASLALFGVELFDQIAVFSVAGIATALLFTLTVLPLMDARARDAERHAAWWDRLEAPLLAIRWRKAHAVAAGALALAVLGVGAARLHALDDVRAFQPRSPQLAAEEARVREALGFAATPSFLLSYGASPAEARAREEAALAAFPEEALGDILAASRLDPSPERRAANAAVLRERLLGPRLEERAKLLGGARLDPFAVSSAEPPATLRRLSGQAGGASYLVAALGPTAQASAPHGLQGSVVVDPAQRYSAAFATYRGYAAWAVAALLGVGAMLVLAFYRTPRALAILVGPGLGAAMAIAAPSALGAPVSFFSVAALFVVIGGGIDHAVFQFEAARTGARRVELGVFLAALTTILTMGFLAFSGAYPVRSFGVAVAVGVTTAYVCSYLAASAANLLNDGDRGEKRA